MPPLHRVGLDHIAFAFDAHVEPAVVVDSGDLVVLETGDDAYAAFARGETVDRHRINAITGPVAVRGAEPGDALRVDVLAIDLHRAWAVWMPDFGPLSDRTERMDVRPVSIEDGWAVISDRLKIPLAPMIGCIGVAPVEKPGSTYEPAYPWGGNMDLRELGAGATLFLPIQAPGAFLYLGDLHAAMGAGEPTWVALEAAGHVTLRLTVEKSLRVTTPRLRIGTDTILVMPLGLEKEDTLERAQELVIRQAHDFLMVHFGLSPFEAYAYCCARVDLRLGGPASPIVLAVIPDIELG